MPSASGKKAIRAIEDVASLLNTTVEDYTGIEEVPKLPEAFPVVAEYLPLVVGILSSIKSHLKQKKTAEETEADTDSYSDIKEAAEEWRSLAKHMQDLFDTVSSDDSTPWIDRYREAVGSGDRLEEAMRDLLDGIRDIAKVPLISEDQIKELKEALKIVKRLPASLENRNGGYTFTNSGSGIQPIHLGKGEQNINGGSGFQVTGKGAHSTVNYNNGQKPPPA
ncbi:hypothetical protein AUP68_09994 [Ilyonectria robusta]